MSDDIQWAMHWGTVLGAPACLLVGCGIAFHTTMSPVHTVISKVIGWIGGIPAALVAGVLIHGHIVPSFGPKWGAVWCFGYGWLVIWAALNMVGKEHSRLVLGLMNFPKALFGGIVKLLTRFKKRGSKTKFGKRK